MQNLGKVGSAIVVIILFIIGFYQQNLPKKSSLDVVQSALQDVLIQTNETQDIGTATKASDCHVSGALPDPACSPGAIFPDATKEIICVSGYTKKVRNVTASTKKKIYLAYGIAYPQPTGSYEMDHIIPLELGGSNEVANLYPEAGAPT
ncbi:MAG: HNH endonuclease, partial [Candidatus Andersenbacteria bacterium]